MKAGEVNEIIGYDRKKGERHLHKNSKRHRSAGLHVQVSRTMATARPGHFSGPLIMSQNT